MKMNLLKSLYTLRLLGGGSHDSIVDVATSKSQFSQLVKYVSQAGLVDTLKGQGPYTVFAPVDEAFDKLLSTLLERYEDEEWSAHLNALLLYHVIGDVVRSNDLVDGSQLQTLEGSPVEVSLDPVMINDANVAEPFDVLACNGVVHAIDEVLLPPSATDSIVDLASANEETFSVLLELAELAGIADVLNEEGPYTVFAPTDEAFEKLSTETINDLKQDMEALRAVLTYHVVPGIYLLTELVEDDLKLGTLQGSELEASAEPLISNVANIVEANLLASNGVVHTIDSVLLPPAATLMTMSAPKSEDEETFMTVGTPARNDEETSTKTIVDIASDDSGSFSMLVTALQASDLVDALTAEGPFTVFAPTNVAFGTLPEGTLSSLLQDPDALSDILLYHVVLGKILSSELTEGPLMTLQGSSVDVGLGSDVTVNNATVIIPDILALNGVIHVIDQVLIPSQEEQEADEEEEALVPSVKGVPQLSTGPDLGSLGGDFTTIIKLLASTGVADSFEEDNIYTVFAPTNEAITKLPKDLVKKYMEEEWSAHLESLLLYHIVGSNAIYSGDLADGMEVETIEGSNLTVRIRGDPPVVMIDDAEVMQPYDVNISNVVVQAIDEVLLPPSATDSIIDIAEDNNDTFSTLIRLLGLAELDDVLDDDAEGPFTVLAPTNDTFAKLPSATVDALMSNNTALTEVLTYQVVSGIVLSSELLEGPAETLQESAVNVTLDPIAFNGAGVVVADILASNGVIHAIDTVLTPPAPGANGNAVPVTEERDGAV